MRILKGRDFAACAKKENITDPQLKLASGEIKQGLVDAKLGGGLYKKRIAKKGQGKRGSYRTIVAYEENNRLLFMYGYSKKQKANMTINEKKVFKDLAKWYLKIPEDLIEKLIAKNEISEVL